MPRYLRGRKIITALAAIFTPIIMVMMVKDQQITESDNYMAFVYEANVSSMTDKFIHKHEYQFSLNNNSICDKKIFLLFLVNTDPENRDTRDIIRETWGSVTVSRDSHIRVVFLVGERINPNTMRAQDLAAQLKYESKTYGDIAKGDFIDAYQNMTYKTVMGLHWMVIYCPKTSFVMKIDDDVMINIYKLVYFLQVIKQTEPNLSKFFYGLTYTASPRRSKSSKWYVDYSEYKYSLYPTYCAGVGYILSTKAATKIYEATAAVPYFWIDDVFMGFCAELSNIKPIEHYFGYYIIDTVRPTDTPWEYAIVKEIGRDRQKSIDAWAYLKKYYIFP